MHYILFVDSENLPATTVPSIKEAMANRGDTYEARVYGCKTSMSLPWKQAILHEKWRFINVKRTYGDGQALDMAMILDIVDTYHTNRQYGIAVASGDSDFLPALLRIQSHGGRVLILTDPRETSKKVLDALPDAMVAIHKPNGNKKAKLEAKAPVAPPTPAEPDSPPKTGKRTIITVSKARDEAIRRICKQAFNEYVTTHQDPEMPVSKLVTAFQKENHWFKSKALGFRNMQDLAMSLGIFHVCRRLDPSDQLSTEWYLRRKDVNYAKYENNRPPIEEVVFPNQ